MEVSLFQPLAYTASRDPDSGATPLVFLHGAGWSGASWLRQIDEFSPQRRCLAIDLPGHGGSRAVPWRTLDDAAEAVAGTIRAQGDVPVHVVGFSLGGDVALRLLARHPELVATALISGVSVGPVGRLARGIDALTWPFIALPLVHRLLARGMRLPPDALRAYLAETRPLRVGDYARLSRQVLGGTSLAGLSAIDVPVLALAGDREAWRSRDSALRVELAMRSARSTVVPCARHAWISQSPDAFTELLTGWLAEHETIRVR